jgi:DNA-binding transcriptional ArsR family regulator
MTATCSDRIIHPKAVAKAKEVIPGSIELEQMGDFFKTLGDPTRLKILHALLDAELCVCDLSVVLGMSVSAVSHQLSVLKQARLVAHRREGKVVFYSLSDDHVKELLKSMRTHLAE